QQQQHLAVNDNTELDWKYLSATETYTSEYSSVASDEFEEDGTTHNSAQVSDSSVGSRIATVQRSLGARPFLVPALTTAGTLSSSLTTKEADDSTDTIKGMRARALDKVNGRKASSSNLSGSSGNIPGSNDYNPYRRSVTTIASNAAGSSDALAGSRNSSGQEVAATAGAGASTTSTGDKIKRRSFGASDRSQSLRITTPGNSSSNNSAKKLEGQQNNPSTLPTLIRKRTSGPVKSQQQQQQQQQQHALFTSEDDSEVPDQTIYQDRTRYASEGGMLVSEIKALKARVQELEMERMNRSLSGLSVQSPQVMTPKSMDHSTTATSLPSANDSHHQQQQQSSTLTTSHSEKLQQIIQKHRRSSVSLDVANPLRSPVITAMSDVESSRDVSTTRISAAGGGRLEPSLSITSPARSPLLPSTPRQPTTQHVDLLNVALKNYENMNQTIRAWVKADVSLVESSSMNALQRASDEQIRSLTEFLLAATRTPHSTTADRSNNNNNNPTFDTESTNGGGSVISRPYSPRQSTVLHHRFGQGQRLSLGMVASELGAGGYDANPPYPTRPLSTTASEHYEMLNAGGATGLGPVMVGNGMTSSGYLTRTGSISLSSISEPRTRSTGPNVRHSQGGYASDYSHDRQPASAYQGLGLSRNQLHQQQQQQQQGRGAFSSREDSPPQEEPRGPVPRRQASGLLMMNPQPTSIAPSRNLQSPQHPPLAAGGGERAGSNTPLDQQQQLTRRQASVRNIMARYSQGAKSPNVSGFEHQGGDLQESVIEQQQENSAGRPLLMSHQYDDGPRSPVFNPRQAVGTFAQDQQQQQQYRYRQQSQRQDDMMSASEGSFGPGHAQTQTQAQAQTRMGGSIRRPLSQQDYHRNVAGSRLSEPAEGRHGSLGVRAGQRHVQERAGAISEDENTAASDWDGTQRTSRGVVVVNPQRASMDSYSVRLKQFRGRHEQQLPFHQEGLSFEEPYPNNGHQSRQEHQQQYQEAFSEGVVDVEAGDALATGPIPRFAQRQPRYQTQTQSQYLDKPTQHRQQQHQHHHQDMMMSNPSLPSPNSSP
ncbi:hypothetical protein BG015_004674, partial [Linnemannia schmuckeri]